LARGNPNSFLKKPKKFCKNKPEASIQNMAHNMLNPTGHQNRSNEFQYGMLGNTIDHKKPQNVARKNLTDGKIIIDIDPQDKVIETYLIDSVDPEVRPVDASKLKKNYFVESIFLPRNQKISEMAHSSQSPTKRNNFS
jgi:hypothetical protein